MVGVEYLGAVQTPVWTQPRPYPPAPLHGLTPQVRVSEGAERAEEGVMILLWQQSEWESWLPASRVSSTELKVPDSQLKEEGRN